MKIKLSTLVKRGTSIASFPEVYFTVKKMVEEQKPTNSDLANVIKQDANMSMRLLQLANSPMYKTPQKIESVGQAISIIGVNELQKIILACSALELFKDVPAEHISIPSFWQHSLACGIAARLIAKEMGMMKLERYFLSGLFHDIGKLLMLIELPKLVDKVYLIAQEKKLLMYEVEKELLQFDHAELGGELLKAWELSPRLSEMVYYHHNPMLAPYHPEDATVIHLANTIVNALEIGSSGEIYVPPICEGAWHQYQYPISLFPKVLINLEKQFNEMRQLLMGEDEQDGLEKSAA